MEQNISIWQSLGWKAISDRSKDLVIALVIATVGLIGTYLILGRSLKTEVSTTDTWTGTNNNNIFASQTSTSGIPKLTNESVLIIQGNFEPEQVLKVSYMNYQSSKKYLVDYGNGIRNIIPHASTYMKYQEPGIYYIMLYEMIDDKWELLSSQSVNIK